MDYNDKFFQFYEYLKQQGVLSTYVELAKVLNTNKAGINDLKNGKKKLSLEHIFSMKKSYPFLNIDWFIFDDENMVVEETKSKKNLTLSKGKEKGKEEGKEPNVKKTLPFEDTNNYFIQQEIITQLKERVAGLEQDKKDLKEDKERVLQNLQELKHQYNLAQAEIRKLKNVQDTGHSQTLVG